MFLISSVAFGQTFKGYDENIQPKGWILSNRNLEFNNRFAHTYLLGSYKAKIEVLIKVREPLTNKKKNIKIRDKNSFSYPLYDDIFYENRNLNKYKTNHHYHF